MKKSMVLLAALLGWLVLAPHLAQGAPNMYFYNPKTQDCKIMQPDNAIEGYYLSGYEDPECVVRLFNMTRYEACMLENGEYSMVSLGVYACKTHSVGLGYLFLLLVLALLVALFFIMNRNS
jgi:hypothetical protein